MVSYNYGICDAYKDANGRFYYDANNKCQDCGHTINEERIKTAKHIGVVCC